MASGFFHPRCAFAVPEGQCRWVSTPVLFGALTNQPASLSPKRASRTCSTRGNLALRPPRRGRLRGRAWKPTRERAMWLLRAWRLALTGAAIAYLVAFVAYFAVLATGRGGAGWFGFLREL